MSDGEGFKGGVHFLTANLATTCLLYNALSYTQRREKRLAINVFVYAVLLGWESYQTYAHWRSEDAP